MNDPDKNQPESLDIIFEALADQRRRDVLNHLQNYNPSLPLANLAEEVALQENNSSVSAISPEKVKQTYLELYHTHIPKLEAINTVHYDQDTDRVALSEENRHFEPFLEPSIPDGLYDCLANSKRRRLLFLLEEKGRTNSLLSINNLTVDTSSEIEYHHVHLPKLADCGFIEWKRDEGFVEQGPQFEEVKPFLELFATRHERFQAQK